MKLLLDHFSKNLKKNWPLCFFNYCTPFPRHTKHNTASLLFPTDNFDLRTNDVIYHRFVLSLSTINDVEKQRLTWHSRLHYYIFTVSRQCNKTSVLLQVPFSWSYLGIIYVQILYTYLGCRKICNRLRLQDVTNRFLTVAFTNIE